MCLAGSTWEPSLSHASYPAISNHPDCLYHSSPYFVDEILWECRQVALS